MKRLLNYSVKEALDHLPDGICFFNKNGTLILCNHQMYRVFLDLTGKDLQSLQELRAFLEERPDGRRQDADIFLLEDGHSGNSHRNRSLHGKEVFIHKSRHPMSQKFISGKRNWKRVIRS